MCKHLNNYPYHKSFIADYDKDTKKWKCKLCGYIENRKNNSCLSGGDAMLIGPINTVIKFRKGKVVGYEKSKS